MPTADKNKATLAGLINKANAVTGETDTTVTDVVDTLIAGYGQGSEEEFVGVKLSGFTGSYMLPTVADLRSIPDLTQENMWGYTAARFANFFSNNSKNTNAGFYTELKTVYLPDNIYSFSSSMFKMCGKLTDIHGDFTETRTVDGNAFGQCASLTQIPYLPNLQTIGANAFAQCTGLKTVNIHSAAITSVANTAFSGCTNLTDIYVPWSESAVANAPWGATNATIHYDTVYDDNHNPVV